MDRGFRFGPTNVEGLKEICCATWVSNQYVSQFSCQRHELFDTLIKHNALNT